MEAPKSSAFLHDFTVQERAY